MYSKYQRTGDRPSRGRGGRRGGYNQGNDPQSKESDLQPRIPDTPTVAMFRVFADMLDAKNDLFETLVKNSRDTTIEAKRIIFLLIRCAGRSPGSVEVHQLLNEARDRLLQLENSAIHIIASLLVGQDSFIFHRAFTPGLQEYIEALSLFYFVEKGSLISLEDVRKRLTFSGDEGECSLPVSITDYLLGIGDLTGELMRFSITHASNSQTQSAVFLICRFAQSVLMEYQKVPYGVGKDFGVKLKVMQQSVFKIERVCYQLALRKSENLPVLPGFMMKVDDIEEPAENGREEVY